MFTDYHTINNSVTNESLTQFNIINPISYSKYDCNTFSELGLLIDLRELSTTWSNTDPSSKNQTVTFTPSTFTVDLPINMPLIEKGLGLNFSAGTYTDSSACSIGTIPGANCIVSYCYVGFCNNITLNILSISIMLNSPIPLDLGICAAY